LVVHFSLLGHSKAVNLAQFHIFAQLMKSGSILTEMIAAVKFEYYKQNCLVVLGRKNC
jgi:hypothetical protein